MLFIRVKDPHQGEQYLAHTLLQALNEGLKVLWLISGGSNTTIACEVQRSLPANKLKNLTLALVDGIKIQTIIS